MREDVVRDTSAPGLDLLRASANRPRSPPSRRRGTRRRTRPRVAGRVSNASPSTSSAHSSRPASAMLARQRLALEWIDLERHDAPTEACALLPRARSSSTLASRRSRAPRPRIAARRARRGTAPSTAPPVSTVVPPAAPPRARAGPQLPGVRGSCERVRRARRYSGTSTSTIPPSTRTVYVSTGSNAGSVSGLPVRMSKFEP